jgi:hypothetical protein
MKDQPNQNHLNQITPNFNYKINYYVLPFIFALLLIIKVVCHLKQNHMHHI